MVPSGKVHKKIQAAGIDVGFFSTKFSTGEALGQSGTEILVDQFPSFAARLDGPFKPRKDASDSVDVVTIDYKDVQFKVGKSVMSFLGSNTRARSSNEEYCKSAGYMALMMGAFFYIAKANDCRGNLAIEHLTIGLPLNTIMTHDEYLAGVVSGEHVIPSPFDPATDMKVIVRNVTVVAQPQGAIVNFTNRLASKVKEEDMCLVLDMGGGTFDWFVCDGALQPDYARCGATNRGALGCANAVANAMCPGLQNDPRSVSKIDRALRCGEESVTIGPDVFHLEKYWPAVQETLEEALTEMAGRVGMLNTIDHILFTGGGATILMKAFLTKFPALAKTSILDHEPVYSNVRGFHQISHLMELLES